MNPFRAHLLLDNPNFHVRGERLGQLKSKTCKAPILTCEVFLVPYALISGRNVLVCRWVIASVSCLEVGLHHRKRFVTNALKADRSQRNGAGDKQNNSP